MEIKKTLSNKELTLNVIGRLDTITAPKLDEVIKTSLEGIEKLVLDFGELEYTSSAGLRVILSAQKAMNKQGSMVVRNTKDVVIEIFEVTGFVDFLTLE